MSEGAIPNKLPPMTRQQVLERAQRILDLRGRPPYTPLSFNPPPANHADQVSDDEAALISEFVQYWLPFLVEKEKLA